jgi:hypothetical protein
MDELQKQFPNNSIVREAGLLEVWLDVPYDPREPLK